jgi:hypothetical protein
MWIKINTMKSAVWKTISLLLTILVYRIITENIPLWIGSDIPFVQVWLLDDWYPLNSIDALFYSVIAIFLISAWIGGALMSLIHIVMGFIIYYWVLAPNGTIGIKGGIDEVYVLFQIEILPLFLLYIGVFVVMLAFDIWKGFEAYKNPCFYPIRVEDMERSEKIQLHLADAYGKWSNKIDTSPIATGVVTSKPTRVKKFKKKTIF